MFCIITEFDHTRSTSWVSTTLQMAFSPSTRHCSASQTWLSAEVRSIMSFLNLVKDSSWLTTLWPYIDCGFSPWKNQLPFESCESRYTLKHSPQQRLQSCSCIPKWYIAVPSSEKGKRHPSFIRFKLSAQVLAESPVTQQRTLTVQSAFCRFNNYRRGLYSHYCFTIVQSSCFQQLFLEVVGCGTPSLYLFIRARPTQLQLLVHSGIPRIHEQSFGLMVGQSAQSILAMPLILITSPKEKELSEQRRKLVNPSVTLTKNLSAVGSQPITRSRWSKSELTDCGVSGTECYLRQLKEKVRRSSTYDLMLNLSSAGLMSERFDCKGTTSRELGSPENTIQEEYFLAPSLALNSFLKKEKSALRRQRMAPRSVTRGSSSMALAKMKTEQYRILASPMAQSSLRDWSTILSLRRQSEEALLRQGAETSRTRPSTQALSQWPWQQRSARGVRASFIIIRVGGHFLRLDSLQTWLRKQVILLMSTSIESSSMSSFYSPVSTWLSHCITCRNSQKYSPSKLRYLALRAKSCLQHYWMTQSRESMSKPVSATRLFTSSNSMWYLEADTCGV